MEKIDKALIIMAAGMGSRYGGLKQFDGLGGGGATLMDYALYDALKAGFNQFVFVIRPELEAGFQAWWANKADLGIKMSRVYQDIDHRPAAWDPYLSADRVKPLGTAHAVWSAQAEVHGPAAVVNADDYYGPNAYAMMSQALDQATDSHAALYYLLAYQLEQTLSPHGTVSRGVCQINAEGYLENIEERTAIQQQEDGHCYWQDAAGDWHPLSDQTRVSMNCWAWTPEAYAGFAETMTEIMTTKLQEEPMKSEVYLPEVIDDLLHQGAAQAKVLVNQDRWLGVTHREDRDHVAGKLEDLIREGVYPRELWAAGRPDQEGDRA